MQDIRKEETKGNTIITNATAVCKSDIDSSEGKDGGECKGPSRTRTRLKVLPVEVVNEQSSNLVMQERFWLFLTVERIAI